MAVNEKNMTSGSPGKLIITFAIPLMLGNVFQQFYTMADTMIVGQVVGVEALAAVGAADWLVWLVFGIMTGMTQGFAILISQYYGAGEKDNLKRAVAKSYVLTAALSILVLVLSEVTVHQVLLFLNTPENVIGLTMTYIRMVFAGIPIIAAYNIFAAILRALGNSRSPLIAMIVAVRISKMIAKLRIPDRLRLQAQIHTSLIQGNRIEGGQHTDVRKNRSIIFSVAVTIR